MTEPTNNHPAQSPAHDWRTDLWDSLLFRFRMLAGGMVLNGCIVAWFVSLTFGAVLVACSLSFILLVGMATRRLLIGRWWPPSAMRKG